MDLVSSSAYTSGIRTSGGVEINEGDYAGLRFEAGDGQWDRSGMLCCLGLVSMRRSHVKH